MSDRSVDFARLYEKMKQAQLDEAERPTILGGEFPDNHLYCFLDAWQLSLQNGMPYRIWEHISYIEFAAQPARPEFLQRAEIFGEGGHLSLRRDNNRWLWHYIGTPASLAGFPSANFWQEHPHCQLRRYTESVMLWGKRNNSTSPWHDDRVAAANLMYPSDTTGHLYLHFWRYTEHGQTAFVWYRALSDKPVSEDTP